MKKLLIVIALFTGVACLANRQDEYKKIFNKLNIEDLRNKESYDTLVAHSNYTVNLKGSQDSVIHIGLNLFNPEMKELIDKETLDYIETELLAKILGLDLEDVSPIEITKGKITDFKKINPNLTCNVSSNGSRWMTVEWLMTEGGKVEIRVPINYDNVYGSSRTEIENTFISKIKKSDIRRKSTIDYNPLQLERYGETEYVSRGANYLNKEIARNVYFYSDTVAEPIWDVSHPVESIGNLLIYSLPASNPQVELTVLKHEYGEKELVKTNIDNLLGVAEADGCVPYWGLESFDGKKLTGSLFLYNFKRGYDHVLKIECIPEDIINGKGVIQARASLFIPTNNVKTLVEPYRRKKEHEKIKYRE